MGLVRRSGEDLLRVEFAGARLGFRMLAVCECYLREQRSGRSFFILGGKGLSLPFSFSFFLLVALR